MDDSSPVAKYLAVLYELLALREVEETTQEQELFYVSKLDALWDVLTEEEQDQVEEEIKCR